MANDYEVRVGVEVDESALSRLDKLLNDAKFQIKVDIDSSAAQQKINQLKNALTQSFNFKFEPSMNLKTLEGQLKRIQTFINNIQKAQGSGIDVGSAINGKSFTGAQNSLTNELKNIKAQSTDTFNSVANDANRLSSTLANSTDGFAGMKSDIEGISTSTDKLSEDLNQLPTNVNKIAEAFDIVEGGAMALQQTLNTDNQTRIFQSMQESLLRLGVNLDDVGGDISQFINNTKLSFDDMGNVISARVQATIGDIRMLSTFRANEMGALQHSGTTTSDSTQENALKRLQTLYSEQLKAQQALWKAEERGSQNTVNDIQSRMSAREQEISAIKEQAVNTDALAKAEESYQQKLNSAKAQHADKWQSQVDNNQVKDMERTLSQLTQYQQKINSLSNSGVFNESQITGYQQEIQSLVQSLSTLGITYDSVSNSFNTEMINTSDLVNDEQAIERLNKAINNFKTNTQNISNAQFDYVDKGKIQEAITLLEQVQRAKIELSQAKLDGASGDDITRLTQNLTQLEQRLESARNAQLNFGGTVGQTDQFLDRQASSVRETDQALSRLQTSTQQAATATTQLNTGFEGVISNGLRMAASFAIFNNLQNAIFQSVDAIRELDSVMTSLQMVTEQSDSAITAMMGNYADIAKDLGVTLQSVAEGSAEWLRQGFSTEQTEELLRASTMLATVGEMGSAEATEKLTAAVNGFNLEASEAMGIVDKLSNLDLAYATSANEIATALQRTASTASVAGVEFDQLAAMITVVSSNTRLSAETIGNGMKSLFSRLQNVKVGKYLDDAGESLNDVEKVLDSLGIKLRESENEWRDAGDVIAEVGQKWQDFDGVTQSAIATALGGTYQRNTLLNVLENWEEIESATEMAGDSAGTAERKYADYMDSIQAHMNQLSTTWSQFLINLDTSGAANALIDGLTRLVEVLDFLINKTPAVTIVMTALSAVLIRLAAINLANMATSLIKFAAGLTSMATSTGGLGTIVDVFKSLGRYITGFVPAATAAGTATKAVGVAGFQAAGGMSALGAALSTIAPYVVILAAVGLAVYGVAKAIDHYNVTEAELEESIASTRERITELESSLESNKQQLAENTTAYLELEAAMTSGSITDAQKAQMEQLDYTNEKLREQIALEERKLELERNNLDSDINQQFALSYGNYRVNDDGIREYSVNMGKAEGLLVRHNNAMIQYNQQEEKLHQLREQENGDIEAITKQEEVLQKARQTAIESEQAINDEREKLLQNLEQLAPENRKLAEEMLSAFDGMQMVDSPYATWSEYMASMSEGTEEAVSSIQDNIRELAGMEVKPKDADSMSQWLDSLNENQLTQLQSVLTGLGDSAYVFVDALNNMDGLTAINAINQAYKEFYGLLDDAQGHVDAFNQALKQDNTEQLTTIGKAMSFINDQATNGVTNYQALREALMLVYGTTDIGLQEANAGLAEMARFMQDGEFQTQKFVDALKEIEGVTIGEMNGITTFDLPSVDILAEKLGISESQVQAILQIMGQIGQVNIATPMTALEQSAQQTRTRLEEINQQFAKTHISNGTTIEARVKVTGEENAQEKIETLKTDLQTLISERWGIQVDLDGASEADIVNLTDTLSKSFDGKGNFKVEGLADNLTTEINGEVSKAVENIDTDNMVINFSEGAAAGLDGALSAILVKEAESAGYTFQEQGTAAGTLFSESFNSQLSNTASSIETTWSGVVTGLSTQFPEVAESIQTNVIDKLTEVSGQTPSVDFSGVTNPANAARAAIVSVINQVTSLNGRTASINITRNEKTVKTTETKTESANGRQMPQFANGGSIDNMGTPLRQETNSNSIVGEEAPEMVISQDGRRRIVGQNGAEMVRLRRGDTVLPANITRMVLDGQMGNFASGFGNISLGDTSYGNSNVPKGQSSSGKGSSSSSSSSSSSRGSSSSSSGSSSDKSGDDAYKEEAENAIKALQYQRDMQYITERDYYNKLTDLNNKYYKNNATYIEEEQALNKELFDLQQSMIQTYISMQEQNVSRLERYAGTEQERIQIFQRIQQELHKQAEAFRAMGIAEDNEAIQTLSEQWWDYHDEISGIFEDLYDNFVEDMEYAIERMERLDNTAGQEQFGQQITMYKNLQVATAAEIDRLTQDGYTKNKKRIQELERAYYEYGRNVVEVYEKIRDAQLKVLEDERDRLQGEQDEWDLATSAVIRYADQRKQALQDEIDAINELNEEKEEENRLEELRQDLENAKKRKLRVYTAENGWQWVNDQAAIDDAQQALDDAQQESEDNERIKELEAEQKAWDDYVAKIEEAGQREQWAWEDMHAQWLIGKNWQTQIWEDMNNNLGKNVDDAVGYLKYYRDEYFAVMSDIREKDQEIGRLEGIDTDRELENEYGNSDQALDYEYIPYDKNVDYMALIQAAERQQTAYMGNNNGNRNNDIDSYIDWLYTQRNKKISEENLDQNGRPLITAEDQKKLDQLSRQWFDAQAKNDQAGMDRAHAEAEAIRSKYDYSGGKDGSKYNRYLEGGVIDYSGLARVDGSRNHSEVVLSSGDAKNIHEQLKNFDVYTENLSERVNSIFSSMFSRSWSGTDSADTAPIEINVGNISLPNVKNANDFAREMSNYVYTR